MKTEIELLRAIADEAKDAWDKGMLPRESVSLKNFLTDRIDFNNRHEVEPAGSAGNASPCNCPTKETCLEFDFDVRRVDYGEDWYPVRASDSEEAAEKWAETDDYCSADYKIVGGEDAIVEVRPSGDENKIERFTVAGESVAMYYASKKD